MFWVIIIIIVGVFFIFDLYKWFSKNIDETGENLGLSKDQTNSLLNLWALFNIGKGKEK